MQCAVGIRIQKTPAPFPDVNEPLPSQEWKQAAINGSLKLVNLFMPWKRIKPKVPNEITDKL